MRIIYIIVMCVVIFGCAKKFPSMESDVGKAISEAVIGKSTNCDILKSLGSCLFEAEKWLISNNKYAYLIHAYNDDDVKSKLSMKNLIPVLSDKKILEPYEYAMLEFENNILVQVINRDSLRDQSHKYKFTELPNKPELDIDNINDEVFFAKIKPGLKKGTVFRIIGVPDRVYEYGGKEVWRFYTFKYQKARDSVTPATDFIPFVREIKMLDPELHRSAVLERHNREKLKKTGKISRPWYLKQNMKDFGIMFNGDTVETCFLIVGYAHLQKDMQMCLGEK